MNTMSTGYGTSGRMVAHNMVTTQFELDGFRVVRTLGVVRGMHPAAADAYELFLRNYPKADQIEHVQLILGIIYSRYLNRYDRAKDLFTAALPRLHAQRDVELAKAELERIESLVRSPSP